MSNSDLASELARVREKSYWQEEDARIALQAWQQSGVPLGTFAKQHGLGPERLRWWWRNRLGGVKPHGTLSPDVIVPVTVVDSSRSETRAATTMEVALQSGRVVRVGADFDPEALMRLVRALEALC